MQNQEEPNANVVTFSIVLARKSKDKLETDILDMFGSSSSRMHSFGDEDNNADVHMESSKTPNNSRRLGTSSRDPSRSDSLASMTDISATGIAKRNDRTWIYRRTA